MQSTISFPDPAQLSTVEVAELLELAARGHVGIDRRWMKAILDRGEKAIPDLVRFGLGDRSGDPVDLEEDLVALFRHYRTPEAMPYLIECIRRQPDDVEDDIVEALIHIGPSVVEPLLKLYDEIGEEHASDLGFVLASLGVRDQRILDTLLDRLEFDAADGAFLLGLYGDPAAKPALENMLAEIDPEDADLRREIIFAIEQLDSESKPEPHGEEVHILEAYPETALPPVEILTEQERLEMLTSASPEYRIEAADSFRGGELSEKVRARLLDIARTDADPRVRGTAWRSLVDAVEDEAVHDAMLGVLRNESADSEERLGALVALAQGPDDPEITKHIKLFYDRPETRARAVEAMWRSLDRSFAPVFPKHLDDPDLEIRRNAIWGVGYAGLASEVGRLRAFFDDEDLRADALFAYAMAMPGGASRSRVRSMFRKIDDLADGLSQGEAELVKVALDQRLAMSGQDPVFAKERQEDEEELEAWAEGGNEAPVAAGSKPGRNDPCPCGSGKKYKKCCGQ